MIIELETALLLIKALSASDEPRYFQTQYLVNISITILESRQNMLYRKTLSNLEQLANDFLMLSSSYFDMDKKSCLSLKLYAILCLYIYIVICKSNPELGFKPLR